MGGGAGLDVSGKAMWKGEIVNQFFGVGRGVSTELIGYCMCVKQKGDARYDELDGLRSEFRKRCLEVLIV